MPASYYVYIVRCADGSLYTGITSDLERRLLQHNGKKRGGARYTRSKGPVVLAYAKRHPSRSEASKREWEIKHAYSREEKEELIARSRLPHAFAAHHVYYAYMEFPKIGAPAMRALSQAGIGSLKDLSRWTEKELLGLHGVGPSAIPKLRKALKEHKLSFKKQ